MPIGLNEENVGRSVCRVLKVYLWLVVGKNIRINSGTCQIIGIDQIMMTHKKVLVTSLVSLIPLAQQLCSEHFPTHHGPDNLNRLWHNGLTMKHETVKERKSESHFH